MSNTGLTVHIDRERRIMICINCSGDTNVVAERAWVIIAEHSI